LRNVPVIIEATLTAKSYSMREREIRFARAAMMDVSENRMNIEPA
jgi:hypothetical protein